MRFLAKNVVCTPIICCSMYAHVSLFIPSSSSSCTFSSVVNSMTDVVELLYVECAIQVGLVCPVHGVFNAWKVNALTIVHPGTMKVTGSYQTTLHLILKR